MNKPPGVPALTSRRPGLVSLAGVLEEGLCVAPAMASLPASPAEYVNLREPSMDMKSVTDRAAQTLLWTELIRGGPGGWEA